MMVKDWGILTATLSSTSNLHKVIIAGISAAGKSSFASRWAHDTFEEIIPPTESTRVMIVNKETGLGEEKYDLALHDLGGHVSLRNRQWVSNISQAAGIVYVIDGADEASFTETAQAFEQYVLGHRRKNTAIAILVNKKDIASYQPPKVLSAQYPIFRGASPYRNVFTRFFHRLFRKQQNPAPPIALFATSMKTNEGVRKAIEWLCNELDVVAAFPSLLESN
jgi:GTPase SAR1 family protein